MITTGLAFSYFVQPPGVPDVRHPCSYCGIISGPDTESCRVCGAPRDSR